MDKENAELKETYAEAEKAPIATLNSQLRKALDQRGRLAEENRVLRAAPPTLITLDDHDQLVAQAVRDERARIRRELLGAFEEDRTDMIEGEPVEGFWVRMRDLIATVDRIVPEEGRAVDNGR